MNQYYDHFCECGCEGRIRIQPHHKDTGVPRFIHGHNQRGKKNPGSSQPRAQEVKDQIRVGMKKIRSSAADREKRKQSIPLYHKKRSCIQKEIQNRPEVIEKKRAAKLRNWQDPVFISKQMNSHLAFQNKIEKLLQDILDLYFPGQWVFVGDGRQVTKIIGNRVPDFIHTSKKLIIELFGDYWHSEEKTGISTEKHVQEKKDFYASHGYRTLIIWEHELDRPEQVIKKIQEFIDE